MKRLIEALNRERNGITGLETAIILIAFVVVASVFAYTVLSAGIFSSQKAQEAIHSGMEQSRSALKVSGSVVGLGNISGNNLTGIVFTVTSILSGTAIDLAPPLDDDSDGFADAGSNNITVMEYYSQNLVARDLFWTVVPKGRSDGDNLLETGEKFEITVSLTGVGETIGPYTNITLEIKPPTGAVLVIQRTVPGRVDNVMILN